MNRKKKSHTIWIGVTLNSVSSAQDDDKKFTDFIALHDTENSTFALDHKITFPLYFLKRKA